MKRERSLSLSDLLFNLPIFSQFINFLSAVAKIVIYLAPVELNFDSDYRLQDTWELFQVKNCFNRNRKRKTVFYGLARLLRRKKTRPTAPAAHLKDIWRGFQRVLAFNHEVSA